MDGKRSVGLQSVGRYEGPEKRYVTGSVA
jgi:hypothetical protein